MMTSVFTRAKKLLRGKKDKKRESLAFEKFLIAVSDTAYTILNEF